ncbi:MAG: hypothetical protein OEL53_09270 [Rhodospirillales bacterium]|nr:hypothetical protein [Rhodospirillales bacterium]
MLAGHDMFRRRLIQALIVAIAGQILQRAPIGGGLFLGTGQGLAFIVRDAPDIQPFDGLGLGIVIANRHAAAKQKAGDGIFNPRAVFEFAHKDGMVRVEIGQIVINMYKLTISDNGITFKL